MRALMQNRRGGAMVEYGYLVALIIILSILAVMAFGRNVTSYFTGASDALAGTSTAPEGSGIEFAYLPPVAYVIEDPLGLRDPNANWLIGTPFTDNLYADGSHVGVMGLASDDWIKGSSSAEIFLPGRGTDRITGGLGADTYGVAPGDGVLWIDETAGDAGLDTLYMPQHALSSASVAREGNSENLRLSFGGDAVVLVGYFRAFVSKAHFGRAEFSDVTLEDQQQFRDMVASKQKTGTVVQGTNFPENHVHTAATDHGYTLQENHYLSPHPRDTLTFTDQAVDDLTFTNSGNDFQIRTADGDMIVIKDQYLGNNTRGVDAVVVQDGEGGTTTLGLYEIRSKVADDMKPTGHVEASRYAEFLFHDMLKDGSYTLRNYAYLGDPLETFVIRNATPADVTFTYTSPNSQTDFVMDFVDGDRVTILNGFENPSSSDYDGIRDILFEMDPSTTADDIYMDRDAVTAKVIADHLPTGYVRGANGSETIVYTTAVPSYLEYYPGYGNNSYVDTLDLSIYDDDGSVTFGHQFADYFIYLPGGRTIKVLSADFNWQRLERVILGDGAGGTVEIGWEELRVRAGY